MSGGNNSAKEIVIEEAESLASDLQNGHSGDPHTQGRAIGLLVKMITPMYRASFMTEDKCEEIRKQTAEKGKGSKRTRIKIGPVVLEGAISNAILANIVPLCCIGVTVFVLGKMENWW